MYVFKDLQDFTTFDYVSVSHISRLPSGYFWWQSVLLIGLLRHTCKFSRRLFSAYHSDTHSWITLMNIVHLVSWIGKYYLGIQIVLGGEEGDVWHTSVDGYLRLPAASFEKSIVYIIHIVGSFHGSSCLVTDSASLASIPVCCELESTRFISVWQFKLKVVLEHARRVSCVWLCDDNSSSIVCLAYAVGMVSHCGWRMDWSTTAHVPAGAEDVIWAALMRPSAVRSGSRQEMTNDMVQIS